MIQRNAFETLGFVIAILALSGCVGNRGRTVRSPSTDLDSQEARGGIPGKPKPSPSPSPIASPSPSPSQSPTPSPSPSPSPSVSPSPAPSPSPSPSPSPTSTPSPSPSPSPSPTASPTAPPSSLIDARRKIDWSDAGVIGGIPNRTTICTTFDPGATTAQINGAITNCPAGSVVKLNPGTYNLSSGIVFNDKSDVTLRGSGPDSTFLVFSSGCPGGGFGGGAFCIHNSHRNYPVGGEGNIVNWVGGYAQGSTQIVLDSKVNLQVGSLLILDQLEDGTTDPGIGIPWVCSDHPGLCSTDAGGGPGRNGRAQHQIVTVTSIEGGACAPSCDIGISPGLYMPSWRASQNPQAWYSNDTPISGVGIEDVSVEGAVGASSNISNFQFWNATNSWIKNVRSIFHEESGRISHHVFSVQSIHLTIRDSYFFKSKANESESGGFNTNLGGNHLIENNIYQFVTNPQYIQAMIGSVVAYNYSINHLYGTGEWMIHSAVSHGAANAFNLYEGNDGLGFQMDAWFGGSHFFTVFRNRWAGWEPQPGGLLNQTTPIMLYMNNRYVNLIGNVLGVDSYHTKYETTAGASESGCDFSIYSIGWGGNCGSSALRNDPLTAATLMRWGNYDTVDDAARFVASEVPSSIAAFSNPVPQSTALPASLYRSSKPAFFGTVPWPAIGPDVTGGSEPGVNGHNAKIPARRCFENVMLGNFSDTAPRTFNASRCYP
jgi:hypothetical protein